VLRELFAERAARLWKAGRDSDARRGKLRLTAEALAAKITDRSKVLMLNFPCNPTGATQSRSELEKIARLCVEHDLIVLTDEIYSELTYDGAEHFSIASLPGMRDRCVFLHGFSKAFAMTGGASAMPARPHRSPTR
jgi:aminotransferase